VKRAHHSAQSSSYLALLLLVIFFSSRGAADSELTSPPAAPCAGRDFGPTIVVGFVGGFVHRDDARHIEVQLAKRLRAQCPSGIRAETFENRHRERAHQAILGWLDQDKDHNLSDAEKGRARIILYGHSWGGSAVISLARELQQEGIPVLLTVQVDSIGKGGDDDRVVPANVARAINFFQTHRPLRGQRRIVAADAMHTAILGNFRIDYKKQPKECAAYPWFDRHIFKWHTAIECDPRVWSQIEALIKVELFTPSSHRL
jgi:pimeloyl-ACP methyl ester carboxylesterase